MTQPRTCPHGVTSWIDTEQPDVEAARGFYAGLFGWRTTGTPPVATLDGQDVAAVAPAPAGATARWNTYVAVDDADATAAAVAAQGGIVVSAPADAGPDGRTATCLDPFGAEFRLRQAGRRPGPGYGDHLAATVLARPDTAWTKDALVRDPQGAEFTVSQFTPPEW